MIMFYKISSQKSSRPALCDSMFSHEFDFEEAHVWGNGHRWEMPRIGLGASKWKGPKNSSGRWIESFSLCNHFFLSGKVNHERCRDNEEAPKGGKDVKRLEFFKCFWGLHYMKVKVFKIFVEAHPFPQPMSSHSKSLQDFVAICRTCTTVPRPALPKSATRLSLRQVFSVLLCLEKWEASFLS